MKNVAARAQPRVHYGFLILLLASLAVFGSIGLGRYGYSIILPSMQASLALNQAQAGELQSYNLFGYVLAVSFVGFLGTRYGARALVTITLILVAAALAGTGLANSFETARLARFLTGVFTAGCNVPAVGVLTAWFAPRWRGVASGVGGAGSSIGLMVTGPLIPWILDANGPEGWRMSWYVLGAISFCCWVLCFFFFRNRPDSLGLLPVGTDSASIPAAPARPMHDLRSLAPRHAERPNLMLVYRSRLLWHVALIYLAYGFSYIIYATFFVKYVVQEAGFSVSGAGTLWFQIGLVSIVSGFLGGFLSDRWGRRPALVGIYIVLGTSFLVAGISHAPWAVATSAGLFSLTVWSVPAVIAALTGDLFDQRYVIAALGLVTVVLGAGQAVAPALAGALADATHSFSLSFLLAGTVAVGLGAGSAFLLPSTTRRGGIHLHEPS